MHGCVWPWKKVSKRKVALIEDVSERKDNISDTNLIKIRFRPQIGLPYLHQYLQEGYEYDDIGAVWVHMRYRLWLLMWYRWWWYWRCLSAYNLSIHISIHSSINLFIHQSIQLSIHQMMYVNKIVPVGWKHVSASPDTQSPSAPLRIVSGK